MQDKQTANVHYENKLNNAKEYIKTKVNVVFYV